MKRVVFLLPLFLMPCICFSQEISGVVIDDVNNERIPYVNIGIVNKGIGTVSDTNGNYKLNVPGSNINDTIKMTSLGYVSFVMKVKDFIKKYSTNNNTVRLKRNPACLSTVNIVPKKMRRHILGNTTSAKNTIYGFENSELGSEIGIPMKPKRNHLTRLLDANFNVARSSYDTLIFRVNVYTMKNGIPDSNILTKPIYASTNIKSGTISVDLRPYNIVVKDDFFVSIEWFRPSYSSGFICWSAGLFNTRSYQRTASQGKWEKNWGVGFYCHVDTEK